MTAPIALDCSRRRVLLRAMGIEPYVLAKQAGEVPATAAVVLTLGLDEGELQILTKALSACMPAMSVHVIDPGSGRTDIPAATTYLVLECPQVTDAMRAALASLASTTIIRLVLPDGLRGAAGKRDLWLALKRMRGVDAS